MAFQHSISALSYENFDKLVARYSTYLWAALHRTYPNAKSQRAVEEVSLGYIKLFYEAHDSFGEHIIKQFSSAYELGLPFREILSLLVKRFEERAELEARPKSYTRKVVTKTWVGIHIPFTVDHIEEYENGSLTAKRFFTPNGGVRIEDVSSAPLRSVLLENALRNPTPDSVYKFIVSNYAVKSIEEKFQLQNQQPNNSKTPAENNMSFPPIKWLGLQKELAELFVELKRKGWIDEINFAAIKAAFTPVGDIAQDLRPGTEVDGEAPYNKIFTTNYKPKFDGIVRNGKTKRIKDVKK